VATRLAEGRGPASLLRAHSPEPGAAAARLDALGLRLLLPGDDGWPLAATPPDPPCAWLFVAGPAPPEAAASVAVVGGRRASPLRRAAARSIGAGLARAGWCVVSGGAVVLWSLIVLLDRVLPHATHHRDTPLGGLLL
jgi:predicted Rossmann fold nucleotide-binding protein DprA/Smf involved in DNA uptake